MSYSPGIQSGFAATNNRSPFLSPTSGMCSLCTEGCDGPCEIGLAAVMGAQTVYPLTTGPNQIASEKEYPLDWSAFNINGRVFGAEGVPADPEHAEIFNVGLEQTYGTKHKVKLNLPLMLPALIKMNWRDYFGGAAMAGVTCIIGEDAKDKDPNLQVVHGKITEFPFIGEVLDSFNRYYRGYGQIVLQCNVGDDALGVPEIALGKYGAKAIEIKFGQSAKGTQPVKRLPDIETARKRKCMGEIVRPDPDDEATIKAYEDGVCPNFYAYAKLPQWNEETLAEKIKEYRQMGAENIYFKMAGYDVNDIERVLRIASSNQVDMITFDGAGGGSGYSPCKMMNEWSLPTVMLEHAVCEVVERMKAEGKEIPAIVMTGGFASEDQVFKSLAFGNGNVTAIGLCRSSMAAAMSAKRVGELIQEGKIPTRYRKYGSTVEEIFADLPDLRAIYGKEANQFSTGAIGVFSYLNKIGFGLQHFAALNRKFKLSLLNRRDLIPLTEQAAKLL